MGRLVVVRHGQASYGAADYDVLSALGERQAAIVGEALASFAPDLVLHGTMKRQRDTARIAGEAAGWDAPVEVDEAWDEMNHLNVLSLHPAPEGELLFFGRIHPDKGTVEAIEVANRVGMPLTIAGIVQDQRYFHDQVAPD